MNKKAIARLALIGMIIAGLSILVSIVIASKGGGGISIPGLNQKMSVECDVAITDPLFGDPNIKQVNCNVVDQCTFAIAPLSLFKERGNVKLKIDGKVVADKNFEIFQAVGDTTKRLSTCTDKNNGIIELVDEDNNPIDSKEVQW